MKSKTVFKMDPKPTFQDTVEIPLAGGGSVPLEFIFKHHPTSDMVEITKQCTATKSAHEAAVVLDELLIAGWLNVEDENGPVEYSVEQLERLFTNFAGASAAVYMGYLASLAGARIKK